MSTSIKSLLRFLAGLAILAVGFLIAQALIGMKQESTISARPVQPRPVKVVEFVPSDVIPVTPIEGRVDALNRMDVFAEVNGVLALGGREFREGMRFRAGEVMLALDDAEPQAALVAQRSQLLQLLSASMADLRLDYAGSWPQWQAYIQAFDVNGPCEPFPEFSTDREQFFLANRGILSAYHTIRSAEERLAKYAVRAPFDGTLTSTLVRPGALVRAGQPLGTFVGQGQFEVKSAVHARYLQRVAVGDRVTFHETSGHAVASGTVERIASNVDASTQSASVFCRVSQVDDGLILRDGRYLSGSISSEPVEEAMSIRLDLIRDDGSVFIIKNEVLQAVPVEVVFRSVDQAIITGLEPGTQLLASPISGSYSGMAVNIAE